jgi:glyoxylase-like metal-dependent hydrolase (beta-lactamase superfamily II)
MSARFPEVAGGVLRMGTSLINWYLVAEDDGVVLLDAGAPRYRSQLEPGLAQLGRKLEDVRAVVLTHGDADHKGFAEKVRHERDVPVYVHSADEELTRSGKGREREKSFLRYLRYPATWKSMAGFVRGGRPVHVQQVETYEDGDVLAVPGRPRVIHAPGHIPGCVALHFEARSLLFVGDVLFESNVPLGDVALRLDPLGSTSRASRRLHPSHGSKASRRRRSSSATVILGEAEPSRRSSRRGRRGRASPLWATREDLDAADACGDQASGPPRAEAGLRAPCRIGRFCGGERPPVSSEKYEGMHGGEAKLAQSARLASERCLSQNLLDLLGCSSRAVLAM